MEISNNYELNNYSVIVSSQIKREVMSVYVCACMCVHVKAFGFDGAERSSFLLLCNLIGKIQAAPLTVSIQATHVLIHNTNMLNLCFLSLYTQTQTGYHHMLSLPASDVCVCVCAHLKLSSSTIIFNSNGNVDINGRGQGH